jgi:hypothetical protein
MQGKRVPRARKQLALAWLAARLMLGEVWNAPPAHAQGPMGEEASVKLELAAMGKRGEEIARARETVLSILSADGGCAVWLEEANTEPAEVFRTLRYRLEKRSRPYVDSIVDDKGVRLFKEPWAAISYEGGGAHSVIRLNTNGPFFLRVRPVMYLDVAGNFLGTGESRKLTVASYSGGSMEAQVTTLLHELGHVVGLLPLDDDSWDGRSSRNTQEMLRHCGTEIQRLARRTNSGEGR